MGPGGGSPSNALFYHSGIAWLSALSKAFSDHSVQAHMLYVSSTKKSFQWAGTVSPSTWHNYCVFIQLAGIGDQLQFFNLIFTFPCSKSRLDQLFHTVVFFFFSDCMTKQTREQISSDLFSNIANKNRDCHHRIQEERRKIKQITAQLII